MSGVATQSVPSAVADGCEAKCSVFIVIAMGSTTNDCVPTRYREVVLTPLPR